MKLSLAPVSNYTESVSEAVGWTSMEAGTRADYQMLMPLYEDHARDTVVDNLFGLLGQLKGPKLGYRVDRYEHSLQSASRAMRADESMDLVVTALLHDVGDIFAPDNHSAAAAAMLAPYVDDESLWVVKHHGLFQGYYYFHHLGGDRDARDQYRDAPHYDACVRFCAEYDQTSFDPDYNTLPLEVFEPMVREVFARPSQLPMVAPPS